MKLLCATLTYVVLAWLAGVQPATAQDTAFTYQGRLYDGAGPASGFYDLRFALYNTNNGGIQQGNFLTNSATLVTNGLFTTVLDFGGQFPGAARWLEIGVRTNGGSIFSTLAPRQQITAAPYAIAAQLAGIAGSVAGANITGTIPNAALPQSPNYSGTVTANLFSGNGAGLTSINAGNISTGTVDDARLSSNVALRNAAQTFTGPNTFNNPANAFAGTFSGNGGGLTNLPSTGIVNGQANVGLSSLFSITNTSDSSMFTVAYEQHVDRQSGEPIVTFDREGDPNSYYWNSMIFQWADVGPLYNNLFDASHYFQAGFPDFRLNGASPYLGGGDNRGFVELAELYGKNGDHGSIWELLPRKAVGASIASGLFAHPLRADGYGRVMVGNIPETIHTLFVPANASLEIVGAPADTAQFHLDASPTFTGTWTSGDIRFDGSRFLVCQQGVKMPLPQMQQTNLTLAAATSFTWQFIWPFADTNYSVGMPTGSAPFSGFYVGIKTTNSVQLMFANYTGRGEFIVQHQ